MILSGIPGLVSRAGRPAPDRGLDVLPLLEGSLRDRLSLMEQHLVLTTYWAGHCPKWLRLFSWRSKGTLLNNILNRFVWHMPVLTI